MKLWHSRKPIFRSPRARAVYSAEFCGLWFAVAIWSNPAARALPQLEWLELRRFAIAPDAPRNTASRMLGWMRRAAHKRFPDVVRVISYSDDDVHDGTIYRADGWVDIPVKSAGGEWSQRAGSASRRVKNKTRWERPVVGKPEINMTHIFLQDCPALAGPKTKAWFVRSKYDGQPVLGNVRWFGRWRKYAFYPEAGCIFEEVCMREISEFIEKTTKEHREATQRAKQANATTQ